ncbi:rna-directed dna polymerase from mobile element jockey-like [Willisornis vidua]|uniref:Rna-directed dna polymerase from mobile element jockey-like n=1 Tax=Willisornis vidua TaxID=1566151 RepID=A0ABQ9CNR6_9PASS|nr:rna-directed dna polymerase from mobile element jockey-like [Willisornis vidua]
MHQYRLGVNLLESSSVEKDPGGSGEQQAVHEPEVCPCGQEGQWDPGVHWEEHCQQVKGGDPAPLFSRYEAIFGVLCPVLGSLIQERHGAPGIPSEYEEEPDCASDHALEPITQRGCGVSFTGDIEESLDKFLYHEL